MNLNGMLKENSLKNKTVLVTGGATGLGRSMAKYFLSLPMPMVNPQRKYVLTNKIITDKMFRKSD